MLLFSKSQLEAHCCCCFMNKRLRCIQPLHRGQRTNPRQQAADWRAIVREDLKTEKPPWPFTCYAHQRSEANDVVGDFQYEEVCAHTVCIMPPLIAWTHQSLA